MIAYFNGQFLPKEEVKISPDDRGFVFADGVYEVIRAYQGRLFKADLHMQRLARSLRELHMPGPDLDELQDAATRLIRDNHFENGDAMVYIQITRGAVPRRHPFPPGDTPPTVYAAVLPVSLDPDKAKRGVKIILTPDNRWARCDIKSVALLPNVLATQQAVENGAVEAVFVRDGVITEGASSNFGAVFNGQLVTPPRSNTILAGITREVVLTLCHQLHIPVNEFPIFEHDLPQAEEMMILSTVQEVMPVVQVNHWTVGSGQPGPITTALQQAFHQLTQPHLTLDA
jgi:D-alanine transaminase